ncbi:phage major capsid protein [Micromonospora sp. WMMA1363]|uniref:phage major capsid protein n=1 Tax=Micromonospora sp. WMMA1363 TaxID=3053985 RepID=UPI00259CD6ED|nr:phage major capsid protein [Micromonospora sp. WMMA1363]MDM4721150.1 phage major capsid protein [Micromonospora sp. WMMA1363]
MRTIDDVQRDMTALIEGAEARNLTTDEMDQYTGLEQELTQVRRSEEIRARNAAYLMPATGAAGGTPVAALGPVAPAREDDGLDRAFLAYLRTGQPNADLTDLRPTNAQSSVTGSEGGFLVPPGFRQKIVERMVAFGGIANVCDVLETDSGNRIEWPTIDDTSNSGEIVEEGSAHSGQADLVFGKTELSAYTYQTGGASSAPLRLARELIQDQAFDLETRLARLMGVRLARALASDLAVGTGVDEPLGLVTGLTGIEPADDTAGITYDDLLTFIHSVDPEYRPTARWVFNDSSLKTIRQIKDSNGDPLWRSMTSTIGDAASTGMLLDYPYTVDQGLPDIDIDANTVNWGAFGDIREGYVLRRVRSIEVVVNPWTRASQREIEYTAWMRADATQQNTNAYVALTGEQ